LTSQSFLGNLGVVRHPGVALKKEGEMEILVNILAVGLLAVLVIVGAPFVGRVLQIMLEGKDLREIRKSKEQTKEDEGNLGRSDGSDG